MLSNNQPPRCQALVSPRSARFSDPATAGAPASPRFRRGLSANEVTPDSRPGCHPGVELSFPTRRPTQKCVTPISGGTKRYRPPVLHGTTSGLSPDPSSSSTPTWGRLPNCQGALPPVSYDQKGPRSPVVNGYGQPASTPFELCCASFFLVSC